MSRGGLPQRNAARAMQEIVGGLALVAIAALALYLVRDLPAAGRVGFASGTAPRLFAYGLGALGAIIAVGGFLREGPGLERWTFRGPVFILGAIVVFAILIRTLGLAATGIITLLLASFGGREVRLVEAAIFAVGMTAFCAILFPIALGQPIPLWPRF